MKAMTIKWPTVCRFCGKPIPVGDLAWGHKPHDKWVFVCDACHRKTGEDGPEDAADIPPEILEAAARLADTPADISYVGGDGEGFRGGKKLSATPPPKRNPLEIIAESAGWR